MPKINGNKGQNWVAAAVIVPKKNAQPINRPIVPQRFNSVAQPRHTSIVHPTLNSVAEPKTNKR